MTIPREHTYKDVAKRSLWFVVRVVRALAIFVGLYMVVGGALLWLWPWSLIALEVLALIWCLVRTGQGKRFSIRGLLILTAGVAAIVATAAYVPGSMLGGGGGRSNKQVFIEVLDESTNAPVKKAKLVLTHRDEDLAVVTAYEGVTNAEGVAELTCYVGGGTKKSILRTWRTYRTGGWSLEAKANGYRPAEKTLSDVTVDGEGGGPINFRVELERDQ